MKNKIVWENCRMATVIRESLMLSLLLACSADYKIMQAPDVAA